MELWEAYERVKANKGSAGVDGQSIQEFEKDTKGNLYKLWNRMSSGSYFPPPVKRVEISKRDGGVRPLGIPTVGDRIAQAVVKARLEPELEKHFHADSYGYRPGRSAIDAVGKARVWCWKRNWVLDLDIKGFFDNISHELLMKAVKKHTDNRWIILYLERWLKAPVQMGDQSLQPRDKGTPQGGVISPLLANLFLHYAFDLWMARDHRDVQFERYADDIICHCSTKTQARRLLGQIGKRLNSCGLDLNMSKTKIVYCKDANRRGNYPRIMFTFLGYTFRPRCAKSRKGKIFLNFSPAVSNQAAKEMRRKLREWRIHLRSYANLDQLAKMLNPVVRGWINYYGKFYKSGLFPILRHIDRWLARWAMRKYKKLRNRRKRATKWLLRIAKRQPQLFAHWKVYHAVVER